MSTTRLHEQRMAGGVAARTGHGIRRLLATFALACAAFASAHAQDGQGDVVYVPTPEVVVDEMLGMANVGPQDFLIDLGSGDGRIVITAAKRYGARGFGVDLDRYLLEQAEKSAQDEGVADRVKFYDRDIFDTRLDSATVITTYLLPELNRRLRPTLLALRPGVRVVTHDYHMGQWLPDAQKTIVVPEKEVGNPGESYVFLWYVPAKIAGTWVSDIDAGQGPAQYEFSFDQDFQELEGVMRDGHDATKFSSRVLGDQVRFLVLPRRGGKIVRHEFEGRVKDDRIEGRLKIGEGAQQRIVPWVARQTERRELRKPTDDVEG